MESFSSCQRDKILYYVPDRENLDGNEPWLLVSFENQWFNAIDLRDIIRTFDYLSPYKNLQLRWLYPQPPQKIFQSQYKQVLEEVDYHLWTHEIIPNFADYTAKCHCQFEHPNETRSHGHIATGNLSNVISNPIILDRLLRGPMFREIPNGDFEVAFQALKIALEDLVDRKKHILADQWLKKILNAFKQKARDLQAKDKDGEIHLQSMLFPAKGKISDHEPELKALLAKYVLLPADKCRGNYFLVCKNLYIKQCIQALSTAPKYQQQVTELVTLIQNLLQVLSGRLHHLHFDLILQQPTHELPYFYTLPKPHKNPLGWRPVAATHRSIFAIPQRILSECLGLVMKTLKEFHYKEFRDTKIRKYWIVENSLDVVLSLPETLTHMYSSDIDSMYQNMDQNCVINSTSEELLRAAEIIGADSFFVVIENTTHGNKVDQCFWHNSVSGLDPSDNSLSSTKEKCSNGQIYPLQNIINLLIFLVKNSYITLGTSVHQINGIPQGGHSSGHLANLTCHHYERKWVERFPFHRLQFAISRYMDDFGIANAPYFQDMYRDIYPPETGIRLIPNKVPLDPNRLVDCKLLDSLIFVDPQGIVHVTLYNKRGDYKFYVNRFPDIDSNVSRVQSVSTFYGEIVRLFRLNTHSESFFANVSQVAAYLIYYKCYPQNDLRQAFSRFLDTQKGNSRFFGDRRDLLKTYDCHLHVGLTHFVFSS